MWQIKQKMQGRRLSFLGYLNKNICSSRLLLRTLSSGLTLTSSAILGLSSTLGWVHHWPLLCLSWSLFSRLPWSDLYRFMGTVHHLYINWGRGFFAKKYIWEKFIFHNLITWLILIQMISKLNSMFRNNSKFCVLMCVFFFISGIEMPFTGKGKVFNH